MIITKKSEYITYSAKTAEIELEINGKTVRVCDWYKQDSLFGDYEGETELNEYDMKLLTDEENEAVHEFLTELKDYKVNESYDTEAGPVIDKCQICGDDIYGRVQVHHHNEKCKKCGYEIIATQAHNCN